MEPIDIGLVVTGMMLVVVILGMRVAFAAALAGTVGLIWIFWSKKGYAGDVAFVSDGAIQMHLAQKDVGAGFRTGHVVNPVERGHIAYRTDDLDAFRAHLENQGIPFSDWGELAVAGWHQIFFYDPDGNIIEVHQVGG